MTVHIPLPARACGAWTGATVATCSSLPLLPMCKIKASPRGALARAATPLHCAAVPITGWCRHPGGSDVPSRSIYKPPNQTSSRSQERTGSEAHDFPHCHPMSPPSTVRGGWAKLLGGKKLLLPMGHPHREMLSAHPHPCSRNTLGFAEGWLQTQLHGCKTPSVAVIAAGFSPAPVFTGGSRSETQLGLARSKW